MDSASKRSYYTNLEPTIPTTPGTFWRHNLLNKVFRHGSEELHLHSETEVLNSGYHNSFDSFIVLFSSVPLPDGRENVFGYSYSSSALPRSTGKGKGKGKGGYHKGKSSLSKSSKKFSKRSIDSFRYRQTPVQVYDFYPIRPVHYVFPVRPPYSTPSVSVPPVTQSPSKSISSTAMPSILPSASPQPSFIPSMVVSTPPSQVPSQNPSISTCQWTVCGNPASDQCSGLALELSNNIRRGGDPDGQEIAVRCCSDTELPDFSQVGAGDDTCPFADTQINGECYRSVNFQQAVSLCASVEARLCTKDELERRCTVGTGCGHNDYPVWSSTSGASGYFDSGDNSFKIVTPSQDDKKIQDTFSCREGITSDLGILTFDEDECSAACLFSVPFTEFKNFCTVNPDGLFLFTVPGPFEADTELYIGNVADSFELECEEQLSISIANPDLAYKEIGKNLKCPVGTVDRLFKIDNVANIDECYNACRTTTNCSKFSVGLNGEQLNCMGCVNEANMEPANGFSLYELTTTFGDVEGHWY